MKTCKGDLNQCTAVIVPERIQIRTQTFNNNDITALKNYIKNGGDLDDLTPDNWNWNDLKNMDKEKALKYYQGETLLSLKELEKTKGEETLLYFLHKAQQLSLTRNPSYTGPGLFYVPAGTDLYYRFIEENKKRWVQSEWEKIDNLNELFKLRRTYKISYKRNNEDVNFQISEMSNQDLSKYLTEEKEQQARLQDTNLMPTENAARLEKVTTLGRAYASHFMSFPSINHNTGEISAVLRSEELITSKSRTDKNKIRGYYEQIIGLDASGNINKVYYTGSTYGKIRYYDCLSASWTSDGKNLLVQDPVNHTISLLTTAPGGQSEKTLLLDARHDLKSLAPGSRYILKSDSPPYLHSTRNMLYFMAFNMDKKQSEIFSREITTGNIKQITAGHHPNLSPDAEKMACVVYVKDKRNGQNNSIEKIKIIDLNPADSAQSPYQMIEGESPAWSPDGSQIAFVNQGDIYLYTLEDKGIVRLTSPLKQNAGSVVLRKGALMHLAWGNDGFIYFINTCIYKDASWKFNKGSIYSEGPVADIWRVKP